MTAGLQTLRNDDPVPSERAGSHERVRARAFDQARRHSNRVRWLKLSLPATAAAIFLGFVAYSFASLPGNLTVDIASTAMSDGKLVMANPKLEGFTNNRPYTMMAERALTNPKTPAIIELEGIDAKVPVSEGVWANVDAKRGLFNRDKNLLRLGKEVIVTTTDGKRAVLKSAVVNIRNGNLATSNPIEITMDGFRISADSMKVTEKGTVVTFERRVQMNINPEKMKTAQAEDGAGSAQN